MGLPLLVQVLVILIFGYNYQTSDEGTWELLFRGLMYYEQPPHYQVYFLGYYAFFQFLYELAPGFPWFGFILAVLNYLFLVGITCVVYIVSSHRTVRERTLMAASVMLVLFIENLYQLNWTRHAVLLPTAGMALFWIGAVRGSRRIGNILLGISLFLLGTLFRSQAAMLSLAIGVVFLWGYYQPTYSWFKSARTVVIMSSVFLIILAASMIITQQRSDANREFFRDTQPPYINIVDYKNYNPDLKALSQEDSVRLTAVEDRFISDTTLFNEAFMRQVGTYSSFSPDNLSPSKALWNIWKVIQFTLFDYPYLTLLWVFIIVALYRFLPRKRFLLALFGMVAFLGMIAVLSIFLKMHPKLYHPALGSMLFWSMLLLIEQPKFWDWIKASLVPKGVLAAVVLLMFVWAGKDRLRTLRAQSRLEPVSEYVQSSIESPVILTTYAFQKQFLKRKAFRGTQMPSGKLYLYIQGNQNNDFLVEHQAAFRTVSKTESPANYADLAQTALKEGYPFGMDEGTREEFTQLMTDYYGLKPEFSTLQEFANDAGNTFFGFYQLTQLTPLP
ncbi:MAG TPA: hypothetical protein DCE41_06245 [Cytophagales bacterium]|nr:hypothetical protein [Cytophagales bacterium]